MLYVNNTGWPICSWTRLYWYQCYFKLKLSWNGTDVNINLSASRWVTLYEHSLRFRDRSRCPTPDGRCLRWSYSSWTRPSQPSPSPSSKNWDELLYHIFWMICASREFNNIVRHWHCHIINLSFKIISALIWYKMTANSLVLVQYQTILLVQYYWTV